MKKALRCLLMLAAMTVLFILPSAMAEDSISAVLNDADNLSLDRPAVIIVTFKAQGSETKPSVTLKTDGKSALFDETDCVTIPAEKLSDGSYRVRAITTLCEMSGTIEITTSDHQQTSVSFTAKEKADDGFPVLNADSQSADETSPQASGADEDSEPDDSGAFAADRTLVIYAGTANTSVPTGKNVGFSAVLLDSLGKVVPMGGAEEWQWSATLNGEDVYFTETSDHAINVKPSEDGELVIGCVISLGEKQYRAEDLKLQVSPEDTALSSVTIACEQPSVDAGEQITLTRVLYPVYCTDLEGAEVEWRAEQNGETIALGSGSSFVFRPDDPGDVSVTLTITPKGKDSVVSNTVTVQVAGEADETALKSVSIEPDSQTEDVRVGDTLTLRALTDPKDSEDVSYTWSVIGADHQETVLASRKAEIDLELNEAGQMSVCLSARQNGDKVQADRLVLNVSEAASDNTQDSKDDEAQAQKAEPTGGSDSEKAPGTEDLDNPGNDEDPEPDPAEQEKSGQEESDAQSQTVAAGGVLDTDDHSNAGGDAGQNTRPADSTSSSVSVPADGQGSTSEFVQSSAGTGGALSQSGSNRSSAGSVASSQPSTGNEEGYAVVKIMAPVLILGVFCLMIYTVRRSRQREIHYL